MAPMISIKQITDVFRLGDNWFGNGLKSFIDYVNFSIENFKLAFEVDISNGGAVQARLAYTPIKISL